MKSKGLRTRGPFFLKYKKEENGKSALLFLYAAYMVYSWPSQQ